MGRQHTVTVGSGASGRRILERKVKPDGTVREYPCTLVHRAPAFVVVRFVMERGGEIFGTPITIPPGSTSDGWFWKARPYNLYRMRAPGGQVLAHRFDAVSAVEIRDDSVTYRDLVLDWWVFDGSAIVEEDRDELDDLLASGKLTRRDAQAANDAARVVLSRYRHILDEVAAVERRLGLAP